MAEPDRSAATVVAPGRDFHLTVWIGFPIAGALAGAVLAG